MADMELTQIAIVLGIIIVVVVGVGAAIPILNDIITPATTLTRTNDEQHNITAAGGTPALINLTNTPLDTVILVENNTGVANTNFTVISTALSQLNFTAYNTTELGHLVNVTYDFQPPGYSTSSTTRLVLGLIIVLFAVGIFTFIAQSMGLTAGSILDR